MNESKYKYYNFNDIYFEISQQCEILRLYIAV